MQDLGIKWPASFAARHCRFSFLPKHRYEAVRQTAVAVAVVSADQVLCLARGSAHAAAAKQSTGGPDRHRGKAAVNGACHFHSTPPVI